MILEAEKLAHELSVRGERWADTDAAFKALDDVTKSVLSECVADLNEPDLSMAAAEDKARRALKYKEHLEAKNKARRAMNHAKVKYDTYKAYVELVRSREATSRAEMNLR